MSSPEKETEDLQVIADIDRTIHAPARLMIMSLLAVIDSADFTFLMTQTKLTRGNLSSHLSKLTSVGYVHIQKEFIENIPRTLVRLTDEGRQAILTYRESMQQVVDALNASANGE